MIKIFPTTIEKLEFTQHDGKVIVRLPEELDDKFSPVLKFVCDKAPAIYRTCGMIVPKVKHPWYDFVEPDILYWYIGSHISQYLVKTSCF